MDMTPHSGLRFPKGESRRRIQGRQDRAEAKVKKAVRAECVKRDDYCRTWPAHYHPKDVGWEKTGTCSGPSQWAHMHQKRRSKTMGMAPEIRHTTKDSLILCARHHAQYDNKATPRLFISCLSRKGADGPLRFARSKAK